MTGIIFQILISIIVGGVIALLYGLKKTLIMERKILSLEEKILSLEEKLLKIDEKIEKILEEKKEQKSK